MQLSLGCCCGEIDCTGCRRRNSETFTDVEVDIGAITSALPDTTTCTIPLTWYQHGLNCNLWGPIVGSVCGEILGTGSTDVTWHMAPVDVFANGVTLQAGTGLNSCVWAKRNIKLLQETYHVPSYTLTSTIPRAVASSIDAERNEVVTYPYADPIDPHDQWSPVVYPPSSSLCGTSIAGFPGLTWSCQNGYVISRLELSVASLKTFTGYGYPSSYDCRIGQTIYDLPGSVDYGTGTPHWQLRLSVIPWFAGKTTYTSAGAFGSTAGIKTGGVKTYIGGTAEIGPVGFTIDTRNPTTGFGACPPFQKIASGDWCINSGSLTSAYGATCLRWTKPVDCETDFRGRTPIELTLDGPREFIDSGFGSACYCMDYDLNARLLEITGYSDTAIITPVWN